MPRRSFASPDSIVANKRIKRGASTRGTKNVSTVSHGGTPKVLTYQGTPVSTTGIPISKAPKRAAQVRATLSRVRKAYKSGPDLSSSGLDPGQRNVVRTLLRQGDEASRKLKLSAIETGLVESNLTEIPGGDADSQNWRQERAIGYADDWAKTGGPLNTKASAKRYYQEAKGFDAPGKSAGQIAADTQRPAAQYRGRYNEVQGEAKALLRAADKPKIKPKPKDLQYLTKIGLANPRGKTPRPGDNKRPFKGVAKQTNVAKIISPKWDRADDGHTPTLLAKGISKPVKKWSKRYDVTVGAGYDPGGGHESPGHNVQGTATDLYPKQNTEAGWDKLEKGLKVLARQGFEVGYGTNGVGQAWANHGRGNHAHVEWVGQGSDPKAIKRLAGLTYAQVRKMANSSGGGGTAGVGSSSGDSSGGGSSAMGTPVSTTMADQRKLTYKQKLARIQGAYTTLRPAPSTGTISRKYGSPVV